MSEPDLVRVVRAALEEDVGRGDVTTEATVPEDARAVATITQKEPGVLFGFAAAELTFHLLDPEVEVEYLAQEGEWREAGAVLRVAGSARALLTGERTALNFLQRLSGIATQTARYVRMIEGTGAQILDTRKTTPGLRALEKQAVAAGGGTNHRFGLWDAVLVKENHIAIAGGITEAVRRVRERAPDLPLVVEVRNPAEIYEALRAGAPRLLLDNMTPAELLAAVAQVDRRAVLEASGGVTQHTLREVAETGVQLISVGALTHSAPALDLSLLIEALP